MGTARARLTVAGGEGGGGETDRGGADDVLAKAMRGGVELTGLVLGNALGNNRNHVDLMSDTNRKFKESFKETR
jgi:hypothetical protein